MLRRLAAHPFLAVLILAGSAGLAHADTSRRSISVDGQATTTAAPDVAYVTIGVESTGKVARDVLSANSKTTGDVIQALKAQGIDARDLQTSGFAVRPEVQRPQNNSLSSSDDGPTISGYTVSNTVNVTLHDLPKLGEVLDRAVTAGANSIDGVAFDVTNQTTLLDEARKNAFEDARRKAQVYAAASGLKLGRALEITESNGNDGGGRMFRARAASPMAVPIEAGQSTLGVSVSVRFELED